MALIVTGIFNNAGQAQQAVENLISSGFMGDCIDFFVNNSSDGNPGTATKSKEWMADTSNTGSGIDHLGCNTDDATYKSAFVAGGASVVTIRPEIDELAKLAAGVLDDSGAVDIEKKGAEYGSNDEIV